MYTTSLKKTKENVHFSTLDGGNKNTIGETRFVFDWMDQRKIRICLANMLLHTANANCVAKPNKESTCTIRLFIIIIMLSMYSFYRAISDCAKDSVVVCNTRSYHFFMPCASYSVDRPGRSTVVERDGAHTDCSDFLLPISDIEC